MIKQLLLSLIILASVATANEINSTTYGNFTFSFTTTQVLGEKLTIGVFSNNTYRTDGFSCKTFIIKEGTPILNDYQISNIKGFSQNQLEINIPIDDRFQNYNYYNVSSNCVMNGQNFEKQQINFPIYIEPSSSFNLLMNFQLWLIKNGVMLVLGTIFVLLLIGAMLVFF